MLLLCLVSGIPGSGKSTLCRAFLDENSGAEASGGEEEQAVDSARKGLDVHYLNFDDAEQAMTAAATVEGGGGQGSTLFDPRLWKDARGAVEAHVRAILSAAVHGDGVDSSGPDRLGTPPFSRRVVLKRPRCVPDELDAVVLLDDNFYYRSMRHVFLQMAREHCCGFAQLVVSVPIETAMARNSRRVGTARVPDSVLERMSRLFEGPEGRGAEDKPPHASNMHPCIAQI